MATSSIPDVAKRLNDFVYSAGGSRDYDEAYRAFRGRVAVAWSAVPQAGARTRSRLKLEGGGRHFDARTFISAGALARTSQLHAGLAALQASVSSAGGSFLNTVLNDSSTFDCTTGSDCTPTQAGVSLPISAFIIAIASAAP